MAQHIPHFQPFLFCVSELTIDYKPNRAPRSTPGDRYWVPPADRGDFRKQQSQWYAWNPRRQQTSRDFRHIHLATAQDGRDNGQTKTCSIFWDPERHGYVLVPFDCTMRSDHEITDWRRLSFRSERTHPQRHIALAGYEMADFKLPFVGPQAWFDRSQLLSAVYRGEGSGGNNTGQQANRQCGLAGNLAVLIALLAFSTTPGQAHVAVDRSFRPNIASTTFQPHNRPVSHRNTKRGMVVEIRVPDLATLRQWENGRHGPIFT
ncbi:uncharacterized protein PV06_01818 [Exophiala oligosperma]|uniref:Uncharacterized protein n=2 Tax=Chaetothyriales TaxID=34395 RepID=A0A0D2DUD8_9EURO|nr:uncharacterized protein PV06_01818 [Exophiala oligosperma]KAJ9610099.1 hypothetical protein H2204_015473 [Knufia peltigerae]KIW46130.1 hypothetical protein PV06_01818 [Exophiala oligosperma]